MDLVLKPVNPSVAIDDEGGDQQSVIGDSLGAKYNRDLGLGGGRRHGGPGAFEKRRVGRRHRLPHSSIAWNKAFRKADEARALDGSFTDGLFRQDDRLGGSCREPKIGQSDSVGVHFESQLSLSAARASAKVWQT